MFKKQFETTERNFKRLSLENINQESVVASLPPQTNLQQSSKTPKKHTVPLTTNNDFYIEDIDHFLDQNVTGSEVSFLCLF